MRRTSYLIILFLLYLIDFFFLVVTSANPEYTGACLKSQVNNGNESSVTQSFDITVKI